MAGMYAKIFRQIFDSSIAENYRVRHVFEDLLKLCDPDGVVDMTLEAVARTTNAPLEEVREGITELLKPDPDSRTKDYEGRRIIPIDKDRKWGWIIVNYDYYRKIQDEDARRAYNREAKRRSRERMERKKMLKNGDYKGIRLPKAPQEKEQEQFIRKRSSEENIEPERDHAGT